MNYCIIWLIALIVFVIAEALTYQLVTIWFAFGALGALLCALSPSNIYVQTGVFFAISAVLLFILRPISIRHFKKKSIKTNAESIIGKSIILTEEVDNEKGTGKAKISGIDWMVRSSDDAVIPKGSKVKVEKIDGVKLIVSKEG